MIDETAVRELTPRALGVLVGRGVDFATAEEAVQEALMRASSAWEREMPTDPQAWLVTAAWRIALDTIRATGSRREREVRFAAEPPLGDVPSRDDTLQLYFLCASPALTASSAVALTLRAVGGLTTRQIAEAYLVPEATMAQRISRAKRTIAGQSFDSPGDLRTVMRVLYLVFNEGYSGEVDLCAEAIRLSRQLDALVDHPEVRGLLALQLLHHARRDTRRDLDGITIPLPRQDRTRWDSHLIAEGVDLLQGALARDACGEYQAQAAIAALHADAPSFALTDWVQIVGWYDELLAHADTPVARVNRAVALGHADGAPAGLAALALIDAGAPRHAAAEAHLRELAGERHKAASLHLEAARRAPSRSETEHHMREAARLNSESDPQPNPP